MTIMSVVPEPLVGAAMPMMTNGGVAPPAGTRSQQSSEANKTLLNTHIYEYFMCYNMFECARALLKSDPHIKFQDGLNIYRDENGNPVVNGASDSVDVDRKDGIDNKRPEDLPQMFIPDPNHDKPFLYKIFCLFWGIPKAQKGDCTNFQVTSYMNHIKNQSYLFSGYQGMLCPDRTPEQQQELQIIGMKKRDLAISQQATANYQNNPQTTMLRQKRQSQQQDPSIIVYDCAQQSSPRSGVNDSAPPKRRCLDSRASIKPTQLEGMPNKRPRRTPEPAKQGMPDDQIGSNPSSSQQQSKKLLLSYNIDPALLEPKQFAIFHEQSATVQQKTIQTYIQNLLPQQSQQIAKDSDSPNADNPPSQSSFVAPRGPESPAAINTFCNADVIGMPSRIRFDARPNVGQQPRGGNHVFQDYQMQLKLLEQQHKQRLMKGRQERDRGDSIQEPREGATGPSGPCNPPGATVPFQGSSQQATKPRVSPNLTGIKGGPLPMNTSSGEKESGFTTLSPMQLILPPLSSLSPPTIRSILSPRSEQQSSSATLPLDSCYSAVDHLEPVRRPAT